MGWDQKSDIDLLESVKAHIRKQYEGIFSDIQMARYFRNYVELDLSEGQLLQVQEVMGPLSRKRFLDLGCGFGSFILVCRKAGIEAIGIDTAQFDLDFARKRLVREIPELTPESVYLSRDAHCTQLENQSFDVVTAWNLLEHVYDYKGVFREVYRVLKPGGIFFGVAPNYLAFRREAHYHVPWLPLLPRLMARSYLHWLGRRTDFFERHVYYVTNWGILGTLQRQGFNLVYPALFKVDQPDMIHSPMLCHFIKTVCHWHLKPILKVLILANYWNPFRSGVYFMARKPL